MRAYFGKDWAAYRKSQDVNVIWDATKLQNGHTLFLGRPGAGKTHQLRRFLQALIENNQEARIHVFDVHDDIELPGASEVYFSGITPYGLNPLRVSQSPHFGGVNKCISSFIRTVSSVSGALGARQQALLRTILLDVYRSRGFDPQRPESWVVNDSDAHPLSDGADGRLYLHIPFDEKEEAKSVGNIVWDKFMRAPGYPTGCWWTPVAEYNGAITRWLPAMSGRKNPTLEDVILYAKRQLMITFMGSDQEAVTALEAFLKASRAHSKQEMLMLKSGGVNRPDNLDATSSAKERAAGKAMEAYGRYLDKTRTGDELEDLIKYDKVDNLKSLIDRLETLAATGIFKNEAPPFDPDAAIWRYRISPLSLEEKRLFALFKMQELYYEAIERGQSSTIRDIWVLDEAHLYADEGGDDILSTAARELRKFGVAIIAANQTPKLPEAFIASLATKVVLGIDQQYWQQAISKMGMNQDLLRWISPRNTMAVQMHDTSTSSGEWRPVLLRKPPQAAGVGHPVGQAAAVQ